MKTAMPYVDIFAGLKIFKDRREFERILGKSIAPPSPQPYDKQFRFARNFDELN